MSDIAIKVENLSKLYKIGVAKSGSLRETVADGVNKIIGKNQKKVSEDFWALQDVNFEIKKGEAIGIIGKNGAGKSTLLKILSRITEPTSGRIEINGRVSSLLEVGTGFHPELSGRENVFLNGTILGMTRREIREKFDEIIDFSGVEKFIDTPVKHYSSGMYVRLAFAVAAHLEPEILIIDEVLAVGDAEFQKKCLGKMDEVAGQGRTVIFVSHNMGTVSQLCTKSILMQNGQLITFGDTENVIDLYLNNLSNKNQNILRKEKIGENHFQSIIMCDSKLLERESFKFDESISVKIGLILPEFHNDLELAMRLIDKYKKAIFTIHEKLDPYYTSKTTINLIITIPKDFLTPGNYSWVMCINHPGVTLYDLQDDVLPFTIVETGSEFSRYEGLDYGSVFAKYSIKLIDEKVN